MKTTMVCFSHLRWNFTFQRPNHLMSHFARERRVFYVEEPVFGAQSAGVRRERVSETLTVCTPHLPDTPPWHSEEAQARLLSEFFASQGVNNPVLWFYTPMALPLADGLRPSAVVYDCMDELSLFLGAPPELLEREEMLLERADIVFTGGHSLYESKRNRHRSVHAFPSSVDVHHFSPSAHEGKPEPEDQRSIRGPKVGFFGVIDERMDLQLLSQLSRERPEYQFVVVGPVVKIPEDSLPRAQNIHYLGPKPYAQLPLYLRGWDVAMMPFALNDSTRFISPTKTLEYIAGGRPVVSTAVRDVVVPYGQRGLVRIADHERFASAIDGALSEPLSTQTRADLQEVLWSTSWDKTWRDMSSLLDALTVQKPVDLSRIQSAGAEQGATECSTI